MVDDNVEQEGMPGNGQQNEQAGIVSLAEEWRRDKSTCLERVGRLVDAIEMRGELGAPYWVIQPEPDTDWSDEWKSKAATVESDREILGLITELVQGIGGNTEYGRMLKRQVWKLVADGATNLNGVNALLERVIRQAVEDPMQAWPRRPGKGGSGSSRQLRRRTVPQDSTASSSDASQVRGMGDLELGSAEGSTEEERSSMEGKGQKGGEGGRRRSKFVRNEATTTQTAKQGKRARKGTKDTGGRSDDRTSVTRSRTEAGEVTRGAKQRAELLKWTFQELAHVDGRGKVGDMSVRSVAVSDKNWHQRMKLNQLRQLSARWESWLKVEGEQLGIRD